MGKRRVVLALDQEVAELLEELAVSPRKKGDLVARLLRQAQADSRADAEPPLTRIEQRLDEVERKLDLLLARPG